MIQGGYYIKARRIQESEISTAPPHVREIWDWLIKEANHRDNEKLKRGSMFRSLKDIQEGLKWYVGYRKETYSKSKCEMAMKWLRKHGMIETTKTTRGMLITVCNYDTYQDPQNYESNNEKRTKATRKQQSRPTINKNERMYKEIKKNIIFPDDQYSDVLEEWFNYKDQKGEYYVVDGMKKMISQLITKFPTTNRLRSAVDNSMINNYKGVYAPKQNTQTSFI